MIKGIEDFQKMNKDNIEATVRSFGEVNKGFQAIATDWTDYSKKAFEEGTAAFEKLAGAKSVEQAIEIQSSFAKKAYDDYVSQVTKLSEMYVGLAKEAYKPVEAAVAKKA